MRKQLRAGLDNWYTLSSTIHQQTSPGLLDPAEELFETDRNAVSSCARGRSSRWRFHERTEGVPFSPAPEVDGLWAEPPDPYAHSPKPMLPSTWSAIGCAGAPRRDCLTKCPRN